MVDIEQKRISASRVSSVITALRPHWGLQQFAKEGKLEHHKALYEIAKLATGTYPWGIGFTLPFEIDPQKMETDRLFEASLRNGLILTAKPDIIIPELTSQESQDEESSPYRNFPKYAGCIEVKPRFAPHHAIQTVLSCMAVALANDIPTLNGLIYTWRDKKLFLVKDGGEPVWDKLVDLCWFALDILETQARIDELKKVPIRGRLSQWDLLHGTYSENHPDLLRIKLSRHIVSVRQNIFDPLFIEIWDELNKLITQ